MHRIYHSFTDDVPAHIRVSSRPFSSRLKLSATDSIMSLVMLVHSNHISSTMRSDYSESLNLDLCLDQTLHLSIGYPTPRYTYQFRKICTNLFALGANNLAERIWIITRLGTAESEKLGYFVLNRSRARLSHCWVSHDVYFCINCANANTYRIGGVFFRLCGCCRITMQIVVAPT